MTSAQTGREDSVIIAGWQQQGPDLDKSHFDTPLPPTPVPKGRQKRKPALVRGAEAREVRGRSRDIYTGDVPLSRIDKSVSGEGLLEIHNWVVMDFVIEDMIDAFAQPFTLNIEMLGVKHRWTPDGLIRRRHNRDLLTEVKPLEAIQPNDDTEPHIAQMMKRRVDAMREAADDAGLDFMLMTENEIRLEPRFFNAMMMDRALGANVSDDIVADVLPVLRALPDISDVRTVADLIPKHRSYMLMVICVLDRAGALRLDRANFFTPDAEFENYLAGSH
jgi:hypothetical protein